MTSKGRYRVEEWKEFEEVALESGVKRQKCQHCESTVSSKVERLREHLKKCKEYSKCQTSSKHHEPIELLDSPVPSLSSPSPPSRTVNLTMDRFVHKTSELEKKSFDMQFARAFYASNISFSVAENEHMKKLIFMLRGESYKPPSRHDLGGHLLDAVHKEVDSHLATDLEGQFVTLIQDGWSNIHNQPVIGSCLHNGTRSFFIRSVDAGSEKKNAEFCCDKAENEIDFCESTYKCKVNG